MKTKTTRAKIAQQIILPLACLSGLGLAGYLIVPQPAAAQPAPAPAQDAPQSAEERLAARIAAIRTPPAPDTPRINGPRVFGARPGHPFLYHIPATGVRPIAYSADNLPASLSIDPATGNITGTAPAKGTYKVTFTATNASGKASTPFTIEIGDQICLTPPMGWNSWNFFAGRVKDSDIRGAADSMTNTGLIDHGWTYINIDDTWELGRSGDTGRDASGKIQTNQKFPDMKALGDYIHSKGLKFGIYSSPGPTTCGGYTGSYQHEDLDAESYAEWGIDYVKYDECSYSGIRTDIRTPEEYAKLLSADDAVELKRLVALRATLPRPARGGGRRGQAAAPATTASTQPTYAQVNQQINALYANINPEQRRLADIRLKQEPYIHFRQSLNKVKRDIVYSLCQYGDADVWTWGSDLAGGNLWRTTGDILASYNPPASRGGAAAYSNSITTIGFGRTPALNEKYAGPGHWNDPDMLEVGNSYNRVALSPDENYSHMTQWCILAAPLLMGNDMPNMDKFVLSLFTNDEVLAVDQDSLGAQGHRVKSDGAFNPDGSERTPSTATFEVWAKPLADGTVAIALYNRSTEAKDVSITWADLKLTGAQPIRDLWRQKDMPADASGITIKVNAHGAELFKVGTPKAQ